MLFRSNVSGLPPEAIEALTLALKGVALVPAGEAFEIVRARKHGHVEAVLAAARRLGLARLLDRTPSRERDLCLAMIAARVLAPGSKLACTRQLDSCTLGQELDVAGAVSRGSEKCRWIGIENCWLIGIEICRACWGHRGARRVQAVVLLSVGRLRVSSRPLSL